MLALWSASSAMAAAPTVTFASPNTGPTAGGTSVTLTGTNLTGADVTVGGTSATVTSSSGTSLTLTTPAHVAGTVDIVAATADGSATLVGGFTYMAPPTISAISPLSGPAAGGTTVTITGTNLWGATSVLFGGAAASFAYVNATTIVATVPPGTGTVNIQVYTPGGRATLTNGFTYIASPTVTNVAPSIGPVSGGTTVVLAGTGFLGVTEVRFGATAAPSFTVNNDTLITATAPAGAAGTVDITVTRMGVTSSISAADRYTYQGVPTITLNVSPVPDPAAGTPYSQTIQASGGTAPYTYSIAGTLPAGLSIDPATGTISGTPTQTTIGNSVTVTAQDANHFTGSMPLSIRVLAPNLSIDVAALNVGTLGTAYTQAITVSGGVAPYAITVTGLPNGLAYSGGTISGVPTQGGAFAVTIRAQDATTGTGAPFSRTLTLPLAINTSSLVVTPATLATPIAGQAYSQTLAATGGTVPYRFDVTSGTLPSGLTLNSTTGVLSGTPTSTGGSTFTVTVTDSSTGVGAPLIMAKTYTFNIAGQVASAPAVQARTLSNAPVTIHATANAVGGPFSAVTIVVPPASGTAVVKGEDIIYTPAANTNGDVAFAYMLANAVGTSAPIAVTVSVSAVPIPAATLQMTVGPNSEATVDLTGSATGGPFTGAVVVSLSPANAGTATIIGTAATMTPATVSASGIAPGNSYSLLFVPAAAFAGTAVVTYTLSNQNATSAPAAVRVTVTPRKDPSTDPDVTGLIGAQVEAARRFATAQISNYNQRLEMLHGQGRAPSRNGLNIVLPSGDRERSAARCQDATGLLASRDACLQGDRSALAGRKPGSHDARGVHPGSGDADVGAGDGANDGTDASRGAGAPAIDTGDDRRLAFWTAGTVDFGFANTAAQRSGFRFTTGGVTLGADYRFSDQFSIGAGVGYGHDATDIGSAGTHNTGDSYSAALYGSFRPVPTLFVDTVAGFGTLGFDSRRWVTDAAAFANGSRNGQQIFGSLSAGYEYRSEQWLFSPYGRVTASRSTLDQFSETGAGWNALTYFRQNVSTVSGTVGMRAGFTKATRMGVFMPNVRVELQHDFSGQSQAGLAYADLAAGGPLYFVPGSPYGRDRVQIGLGAKLSTGSLIFGLDYNVTTGMGGLQQGVRLTFVGPF